MNIDLDDLRAEAARLRPKPATGVRSLVHGVHGREDIRRLITMESVALPPVPHHDRRGLQLLTLLCGVADQTTEQVQFRPAWKRLEWSWPGLELVAQDDLRDPEDEATRQLLTGGTGWQAPSPAAAAEPLSELLTALEGALSRPWPPNPGARHQLAELYQRVLPAKAIELVMHLAPDTAAWLAPEPGASAAGDESDEPT